MYFEFDNLSQALVGLSLSLNANGVWLKRGTNPAGDKCLEFPEAVLIKIENPLNRYVFVPERKWNRTLGWIESLWIARGDNSLEMPSSYVKNLLTFSDDGETMRAGYGPRIRGFGGHLWNKAIRGVDGSVLYWMEKQYDSRNSCHNLGTVDQLKFVVDKFKQDPTTREAVITIHDPMADDFNGNEILRTKDTPCTRSIHFMIVNDKMNCYVDMRSNDLFWGFSAVNIFNFTLMQEYVAAMVGVPVGVYFHKVDNLHIYEGSLPMLQSIIAANETSRGVELWSDWYRFSECSDWHGYKHTYRTLEGFDARISLLSAFERGMRGADDLPYSNDEALDEIEAKFWDEPMFRDWAKVIYRKWSKDTTVTFDNPYLTKLFV